MNFLLLAALIAQPWLELDECMRTGGRCREARNGRSGVSFAAFEFAPSNGAGMGSACACTSVTSAQGNTLTFTRAGDATCSRQGLATTGISNGDLVVCATDQPRIEPSGGALGLRVEGSRTNVLLRFIDIANATWADVGTPNLGGGQISPFTGALSASAISMEDDAAGAQEGRSQTVTVTAATAYTMSCYVKALTTDQATISLDGTAASITGLSSTTWSIVRVVDASSSGVAIAAQVLVGDAVGDTGSVIWGGCQVEAGAYATSIQPTVAAAVARSVDVARFSLATPVFGADATSGGCIAATGAVLNDPSGRLVTLQQTGGATNLEWDVVFRSAGFGSTQWAAGGTNAFSSTLAHDTALRRWVARVGASGVFTLCRDGTCQTGGNRTLSPSGTTGSIISIGDYSSGSTFKADGIITLVQVDPSPTRCTP